MADLANEFNRFIDFQANLIKSIRDKSLILENSSSELMASSAQIATASDEVARAIDEIAKGATDQASDTERGVNNIVEFGSIIAENQEKTVKLTEASKEVDNLKNEGIGILLDLVKKSDKNQEASRMVSENVIDTAKSIEKIEKASQI